MQRMDSFPTLIGDHAEMDQFGQEFIRVLLSTEPAECFEMMSGSLRERVGDQDRFIEGLGGFREANGPIKQIHLTASKYLEETNNLSLTYAIDCENRPIDAELEIRFSPLRGSIDFFNVNKVADESETKNNEEDESVPSEAADPIE